MKIKIEFTNGQPPEEIECESIRWNTNTNILYVYFDCEVKDFSGHTILRFNVTE